MVKIALYFGIFYWTNFVALTLALSQREREL